MARFVSHQCGFANNVVPNNRMNLPDAGILDVETTCTAATLHESEHGVFVSPTAAALLFAFDASDEGFVGLDSFTSPAHWRQANNAHGLADAMLSLIHI